MDRRSNEGSSVFRAQWPSAQPWVAGASSDARIGHAAKPALFVSLLSPFVMQLSIR